MLGEAELSSGVALTFGSEATGDERLHGREGEDLPGEGWGDLGKVAEIKRNLFMGELEGQVELGAFYFMFLFLSFQFCLSHSTRTSSQPMANPNPGNPQTLSSGK